MYDRRFFASKLGKSALLSIAAAIGLILFASLPGTGAADLAAEPAGPAEPIVVAPALVELA